MNKDAKWLAWFEQQFSSVAGSDRQIDLNGFKEALHVKQVCFIMHDHHSIDCFSLITKNCEGVKSSSKFDV